MTVTFLLHIVCSTLVMVTGRVHEYTRSVSYDWAPFGPRMCDRLCLRTRECSVYVYNVTDLSCHVTNISVRNPDGQFLHTVTKNYLVSSSTDNPKARRILKTPKPKRILKTPNPRRIPMAKKSETCLDGQTIRDVSHHSSKGCKYQEESKKYNRESSGTKTGVLVAANFEYRSLPVILLSNQGVKLHEVGPTNLKLRNVIAMDYAELSRRVIVSSFSPDLITSYPVGSGRKLTLLHQKAGSISVDDKRKLVFLSLQERKVTAIGTVTTDGEKFEKIILKGHKVIISLLADTRRKRILICLQNMVIEVDYQGKYEKLLIAGRKLCGITLDPVRPVMYFIDGKKAMAFHIITNNISHVKSLSMVPNALLYNHNTIYVSILQGGTRRFQVMAVDIKSKSIQVFQMKTALPRGVIFCSISLVKNQTIVVS